MPYVQDVLFILKTDCLQQAHLEGYKMLIDLKATLRQSNLNPERPGIIFFSSSSSDYFHGNHCNLVSCVYFLSRWRQNGYASPCLNLFTEYCLSELPMFFFMYLFLYQSRFKLMFFP